MFALEEIVLGSLKGRTVHLEKRTNDAVAKVNFILLAIILTVIHRIERERKNGKDQEHHGNK